jgi:hypothetical protein
LKEHHRAAGRFGGTNVSRIDLADAWPASLVSWLLILKRHRKKRSRHHKCKREDTHITGYRFRTIVPSAFDNSPSFYLEPFIGILLAHP